VGDCSQGRCATPADFPLHDGSPYSHDHARREHSGFPLPRSRTGFPCSQNPYTLQRDSQLLHRCRSGRGRTESESELDVPPVRPVQLVLYALPLLRATAQPNSPTLFLTYLHRPSPPAAVRQLRKDRSLRSAFPSTPQAAARPCEPSALSQCPATCLLSCPHAVCSREGRCTHRSVNNVSWPISVGSVPVSLLLDSSLHTPPHAAALSPPPGDGARTQARWWWRGAAQRTTRSSQSACRSLWAPCPRDRCRLAPCTHPPTPPPRSAGHASRVV
jgi:hypothetical protein